MYTVRDMESDLESSQQCGIMVLLEKCPVILVECPVYMKFATKCLLYLISRSFSNLPSVNMLRLEFKTMLPRLKSLSTGALDGIVMFSLKTTA